MSRTVWKGSKVGKKVLSQTSLFKQNDDTASKRKRRGPPNRMNDLDYSTWMKYQKSFFQWTNLKSFAVEATYFFTKAQWPDGSNGRILFIGEKELSDVMIPQPRELKYYPARDFGECIKALDSQLEKSYDFALISLTSISNSTPSLVLSNAKGIGQSLRRVLRDGRYCCVLLPRVLDESNPYPNSWVFAANTRGKLKLRDEKIGLCEREYNPYNCLYFQAEDDPFEFNYSCDEITSEERREVIDSWLIPKPPPRKTHEKLHPAKFPEDLVKFFIEHFTDPGDTILDPMAGTGSTLIAARNCGRKAVGVELIDKFVTIADQRLSRYHSDFFSDKDLPIPRIIQGNALHLEEIDELKKEIFSYCITSPPYWSMLTNPGSENQRARRSQGLQTVYSDTVDDLGNIVDYKQFITALLSVYSHVSRMLAPQGLLTIIVKNIKRDHTMYTLAWDLVFSMCQPSAEWEFIGNTMWCQDDVPLKPFAVGTHWVSNILHHHCLHFRKRN